MLVTTTAGDRLTYFFQENKATFPVNCLSSRWFTRNMELYFLWKNFFRMSSATILNGICANFPGMFLPTFPKNPTDSSAIDCNGQSWSDNNYYPPCFPVTTCQSPESTATPKSHICKQVHTHARARQTRYTSYRKICHHFYMETTFVVTSCFAFL